MNVTDKCTMFYASILGAIFFVLCTSFEAAAQTREIIWSKDGTQICFQGLDDELQVCEIKSKKVQPAFDANKVAEILKDDFELSGKPRAISFDEQKNLLISAGGRNFRVLPGSRLEELDGNLDSASESLFFTGKVRSRDGRGDLVLEIVNTTEQDFKLSWVDDSGAHRDYGVVDAGNTLQQHTYAQHAWRLQAVGGKGEAKSYYFVATSTRPKVVITKEALAAAKPSPDRAERSNRRQRPATVENDHWRVFVKDHNLWVASKDDSGEEKQLTFDATYENTFQMVGHGTRWFGLSESRADQGDLIWSPDGSYLIALQTKRHSEPRVHYVESTPEDQLQPKLRSYQYPKPGAELLVNRPRLFSLNNPQEIPLDNALFSNPFDIRCEWEPSGERFFIFYNERGHQKLNLFSVDAKTGRVASFVEESSETFIHYSDRDKYRFERLGEHEFLWSSERTGWNHLYRYDLHTGELINAITSGEWNVKRIHRIDKVTDTVWFYAVGLVEQQDPYHEHFCRVNFDGSGFVCLTEGDGTHDVELIRNDEYLRDTWSRVDQPPVTELRNAVTGEKIIELYRQSVPESNRRKMTTRFTAKGRDGETDIWGIIHWPIDFDPSRSYPVVENIYAGPHDHHVPKRYRSRYRHQYQIADAGMIVVQIDGMGTAWRSKEFHDVCFQNLRDAGFPDRIEWIKSAAKEFPQMDISRVGIYGGSAGGQNAMAALLWHNDFYKVAVADCGCHDNRMDKIWWNEQWMGWPIGKHYQENSNTENAHLLEGKLMLVLGELDQNVDPASTIQVVRKLIQANKDFEFVLVAGAGHGAAETPWASRKRLRFLRDNLIAE